MITCLVHLDDHKIRFALSYIMLLHLIDLDCHALHSVRMLFTTILHYANRSIVMWRFFDVNRGVSSCKLSREYFSLWLWARHSMEILTLQHFRFVQTKQRVINRYITNKTWLNRNWRVTSRLSVTLLTKIVQQQSKIVLVDLKETLDSISSCASLNETLKAKTVRAIFVWPWNVYVWTECKQ